MGNRSDKTVNQITFGANFKVSGTLKFVRVGQIEGYGKGSIRDEMAHPASHCLVAKSKSDPKRFRLLNHLDQRVHSMLMAYDSSSKVLCLVVDESEGAFPTESISFLSGEVFAHQSSIKKLSDAFKEICNSKDKQDLVKRFVCTQDGNEGNTLGFNLTNFVKVIGQNSITKSTADTWLDSSLDPATNIFASLIDQYRQLDIQDINAIPADLKRLKRIDYYKNKAEFVKRLNVRKESFDLKDGKNLNLSEEQLIELKRLLANLKRARELASKWTQLNTSIDIRILNNALRRKDAFLNILENIDPNSPDVQKFIYDLNRLLSLPINTAASEGMNNELHS